MSPPSSSTSSSDAGPRPGGPRDAARAAAWTLLALVALDLAIGRAFPPVDPRSGEPGGRLRQYFNYGWSVEAKLRRLVGPSEAESAPIVAAGWLAEPVVDAFPSRPRAGDDALAGLSIYGMSFSNRVGEELSALEPRRRVRLLAGPAAPPSHSFALYERDRGADSEVVVLAVLASSVHAMQTTTGLTWQFEAPAPYTYPTYWVDRAGTLRSEPPRIDRPDELRAALSDPARWAGYLADLRARDGGYSDLLVPAGPLDHSTLARLARRAVAQAHQARLTGRIRDGDAFRADSGPIVTLRAMSEEFAASARRVGKRPVLLLIEDQGYGGSLERSLGPTLRSIGLPYLATHAICPATDPRNFVADGHFTPECDRKVAAALLELLETDAPASAHASGSSQPLAEAGPGS